MCCSKKKNLMIWKMTPPPKKYPKIDSKNEPRNGPKMSPN